MDRPFHPRIPAARSRRCSRLMEVSFTRTQDNFFAAAARILNGWLPRGCTFGTDGPCACAKASLERSGSVLQHKSANGSTTLKFLRMDKPTQPHKVWPCANSRQKHGWKII